MCTIELDINKLCILCTVCVCVLFSHDWYNTSLLVPLHIINLTTFVMKVDCVFCEAGVDFRNILDERHASEF